MLLSGRSLQEAVMMMIPEAWQSDVNMPRSKKDFYEYHSALMEPWDGPASIVFSDGHYIGAVLDRNGLRPSRYYVTHDDKVIMASEVGVVHVAPERVKIKGRLQPGRMFLLDFEQGRLIPDEELKQDIASRRPYGEWLANQKVTLDDISTETAAHSLDSENVLQRMQAFGYTTETMQFMLLPLVAIAIPLSRIIPPLYNWRIRRRILALYGELRLLEYDIRSRFDPAKAFEYAQKIDALEVSAYTRPVPLGFTDQVYLLRQHINIARETLRQMQAGTLEQQVAPPVAGQLTATQVLGRNTRDDALG
jgi:hypothetical protein